MNLESGFYLDFLPLTIPLIVLWFGAKYNWYIFNYEGRLQRKAYALLMIVPAIGPAILSYLGQAYFEEIPLWGHYGLFILTYILFTIGLSAGMRRMNDVGMKGWWYLILWASVLFFPDISIIKNAALGVAGGLFVMKSK